jgi:hypothetical protein
MNRLLLGLAVLMAACGGHKSFDSLCADQVPAPAACNTACDPSSGTGDATCPSGFHCAAAGKCDTLCTPTGNECGNGYSCTTDGFCQSAGDGDDAPPVDANCPTVQFTAKPVTPSIQLLIDRSGSMLDDFADKDRGGAPPTDTSDPEKYQTVQDALIGTQGVVTQLQDKVYFGGTLFSGDPNVTCPALKSVGRALNNQTTLSTLISTNRPLPKASTPTPDSINAVTMDFMTNPPPAGSPPVIVLATDGLPNQCGGNNSTTTQSVNAAKNAFAHGIKLFILGVGTVQNATQHFQDMANAGQGVQPGQPNAKAYMATDPTTLAAAFDEIIRGVVSCDLKLDGGSVDPGTAQSGTVTLNGMPLTYGTDWTVDNDGVTLHLLGTACDTLKSSTNPMVNATFSCGAIIF